MKLTIQDVYDVQAACEIGKANAVNELAQGDTPNIITP